MKIRLHQDSHYKKKYKCDPYPDKTPFWVGAIAEVQSASMIYDALFDLIEVEVNNILPMNKDLLALAFIGLKNNTVIVIKPSNILELYIGGQEIYVTEFA